MQTFTHASHANHITRKHGFPDGVLQLLCGLARATGSAQATATNDPCGMQLYVYWCSEPREFSCEVFDGRLSGGVQLERFNIR
jgi:hypothetical protein